MGEEEGKVQRGTADSKRGPSTAKWLGMILLRAIPTPYKVVRRAGMQGRRGGRPRSHRDPWGLAAAGCRAGKTPRRRGRLRDHPDPWSPAAAGCRAGEAGFVLKSNNPNLPGGEMVPLGEGAPLAIHSSSDETYC